MSSMRSASSSTSVCNAWKLDQPAVEIIFQPPGSRDNNARSLANGVELRTFGKTADDECRRRELFASQGVVLLHNLHGQFARGNQHERRDSRRVFRQEAFQSPGSGTPASCRCLFVQSRGRPCLPWLGESSRPARASAPKNEPLPISPSCMRRWEILKKFAFCFLAGGKDRNAHTNFRAIATSFPASLMFRLR